MSRNRSKKKRQKETLASQADKYDLYLQSVQEPDHEARFLNRIYKDAYGRPARILREDFCGTFAVCCSWVRGRPKRKAIGVDIDPEPLEWGKRHNLKKLSEKAQRRLELIQDDVRSVTGPKADVVAAQNFSFCIFKTRDTLRAYFASAMQNLKPEGVLLLDMMGGPETLEEDTEDVHQQKGFKYIWEQNRFDPITHHTTCFIHFRFKDGSELEQAFRYDWRLWTIPELRELLLEAGFRESWVYWEGTDRKTGEGNDVFRRRDHAESDPAWIAYIVGVK